MTFPVCRRIKGRTAVTTIAVLALTATSAFAASGSGGIGSGGEPGGSGETGGGTTTTTDPADGAFPIRGKHSYGDGLGAGRGHDGQDLMAKCGKPVVATWSGRVQKVDSHASAGNYVVVDGSGALKDTVYMHLQGADEVREGQRVEAGDQLGLVGDTGNASTCHLHFEIWSNPGYYEGGSPVDPEPYLRAWDAKHRR